MNYFYAFKEMTYDESGLNLQPVKDKRVCPFEDGWVCPMTEEMSAGETFFSVKGKNA